MLEYGVAVIITPMKRFHNYLRSRIADSQQERQVDPQQKDDLQAESENEANKWPEIRSFEQTRMGKNVADLGKEIKVIKQEVMELKARMESIATITLK